jgi:hypothetical protein
MIKKLLLLLILFTPFVIYSQTDQTGNYSGYKITDHNIQSIMYSSPIEYKTGIQINPVTGFQDFFPSATTIRWNYTDPGAIGGNCNVSNNGQKSIVAWDLNNKRSCLYDNTSSTPLLTYPVPSSTGTVYNAISSAGSYITVSAYRNISVYSSTSITPLMSFDLTTLPDTGTAGPIDITSSGDYIIATASRNDSSTVLCFNRNSNVPVWKAKIGNSIYGVNISGNDSLVIVSTYNRYAIYNIYTGQTRFYGVNTNGSQAKFGISGNGGIIATCDLRGYMYVYEWSGTTYTLKWSMQEPPGTYYNWITAVDVSYDGNYIANGSLVFVSSSSYDGKIRLFKTSTGSTPLMIYPGCGDEINAVAFSKNARILTAAGWGDLAHQKFDYYVFKIMPEFSYYNLVYGLQTNGSLFSCSVSEDGTTGIAAGKAVHARQMGSGGLLYNFNIDTAEGPTSIINENELTSAYELYQNFPNPFNPTTNIKFRINQPAGVKIIIYDNKGRELQTIVNAYYIAGTYSVSYDASGLPSGIYYYKIEAGKFTDTKKMILLK